MIYIVLVSLVVLCIAQYMIIQAKNALVKNAQQLAEREVSKRKDLEKQNGQLTADNHEMYKRLCHSMVITHCDDRRDAS